MQCGIAIKTDKSVSPDTEPHIQEQLIFSKGAKTIQWIIVTTYRAGAIGYLYAEINFDSYLTSYTKIKSKWIID